MQYVFVQWGSTEATAWLWNSADNLKESVLFIYCTGSRDRLTSPLGGTTTLILGQFLQVNWSSWISYTDGPTYVLPWHQRPSEVAGCYAGAWNPNSGPHVCIPSTLAQTQPYFQVSYFLKIHFQLLIILKTWKASNYMISLEQKIQPIKNLSQAKIQNNIPKSTLLNELRKQLGRQILLRYEPYSKKKSVYHKVSLVGGNFSISDQ